MKIAKRVKEKLLVIYREKDWGKLAELLEVTPDHQEPRRKTTGKPMRFLTMESTDSRFIKPVDYDAIDDSRTIPYQASPRPSKVSVECVRCNAREKISADLVNPEYYMCERCINAR